MRHHSAPDSQGRLSEKRKQEMLELLFDEMDRLHGRKKGMITMMLGYAWRGFAVLIIALCATLLIMPGLSVFRRSGVVNASIAADTQNIQVDIPDREKLDIELYEMERRLEDSLSNMADLIDRDLTGF
ncbi:MAG: hypothetical protein IKS20_04680 [Victivallales bacterium]|nr:hypothetical protein [Victivallales bacterium]